MSNIFRTFVGVSESEANSPNFFHRYAGGLGDADGIGKLHLGALG